MKRFKPENALNHLEQVAQNYAPTSDEYYSIEVAAKALLYIHSTGQLSAFEEYIASSGQELTPEQKEFLAKMGVEPF